MVKKLQHHGKHHGKQAVTDAEIDASTEDMHKQDADPKDAEKKGLVDIIEILGHWFKELAEKKSEVFTDNRSLRKYYSNAVVTF